MFSLFIFILKTFDIFGKEPSFSINGKKKSKSVFGGFASIGFYGFVLWAVYQVGNDMILKKQPKTITSDSFIEDPTPMFLSPNTFTFAFGLQHPDTYAHYINESIYTVEVTHQQVIRELNEKGEYVPKWNITSLEFEECTKEHFGNLASKFANLELTKLYCLKKEQPSLKEIRIQGVFESPIFEFVQVDIKKCNISSSKANCTSQTEMDKLLGGGWFAVYYPNLAIDPKNYSYPNTNYRDSYYTSIGTTYYKEITMNLNHVEISTDSGWLMEQIDVNRYIKFDYIREKASFRPDPKNIMSFLVRVDKITSYYERSYRKVQDIMADVDGLATLALFFAALLIGPYSEIKFYESLINKMFDIKLLQKKLNSSKKLLRLRPKQARLENLSQLQHDQIHLSVPYKNKEENLQAIKAVSNDNSCDLSQLPLKEDISISDVNSKTNRAKHNTTNESKTNKLKKGFLKRSQLQSTSKEIIVKPLEIAVAVERKDSISSGLKASDEIPKSNLMLQKVPTKKSSSSSILSPESIKKEADGHHLMNVNRINDKGYARILRNCEFASVTTMQTSLKNLILNKEDTNGQAQIKEITNQANLEKVTPDENDIDKDTGFAPKVKKEGDDQVEQEHDEPNIFERLPTKLSKPCDKIDVSFWEYMRSYIWTTQPIKEKMRLLEEGIRQIEERLNIFETLKKFRDIDRLKLLLLESEQFVLFDTLPKPKLQLSNNNSDIKKGTKIVLKQNKEDKVAEEKIKKELIISSYKNLKMKHQKTMVDDKLLEICDDLLKY